LDYIYRQRFLVNLIPFFSAADFSGNVVVYYRLPKLAVSASSRAAPPDSMVTPAKAITNPENIFS
jgi:hypothetical protein